MPSCPALAVFASAVVLLATPAPAVTRAESAWRATFRPIAHELGAGVDTWQQLTAARSSKASLRLQGCVDTAVRKLGRRAGEGPHLAIGLVDLSGERLAKPVVAFRHETRPMYAASIVKLGALISAHQLLADARAVARQPDMTVDRVKATVQQRWRGGDAAYSIDGKLTLKRGVGGEIDVQFDPKFAATLLRMARHSDNAASTDVINALGFPQIASVLAQQDLYHPARGGGLWVGRGFGGARTAWRRDPFSNHSHSANVAALATVFTRLGQDKLIDEAITSSLKGFLSNTVWDLKFVRGWRSAGFAVNEDRGPVTRRITIWRKSGSMEGFSHDAMLAERVACLDRACRRTKPLRYVAVAMADSPSTLWLLPGLARALDACIVQSQ